jgi:hypothetical protein
MTFGVVNSKPNLLMMAYYINDDAEVVVFSIK